MSKISKPLRQEDAILKHLQSGKSITPLIALERYGSFRLSAVIFKLRARGHNIAMSLVGRTNGKTFGSYKLVKTKRSRGLALAA